MIAEWQLKGKILMTLPHEDTDWAPILCEAQQQTLRIVNVLLDHGKEVLLVIPPGFKGKNTLPISDKSRITFVEIPTNDTWTRDYGPICCEENGELKFIDFGFNGWGLKFAADKDNLVNRYLNVLGYLPPETYKNESAFILEGGSVDADTEGTILTTTRCLCSPNRNGGLSKAEAEHEIKRRLGAKHVLFLDYGALEGDDTDSHIDTLARMAPGNTIIFTGCRDENDSQFEELLKMRAQLTTFRTLNGEPYNLIELPLPDAIFDETGQRLPATYANYLITSDVIFMPTYQQPAKDELAAMTLKIAFPEHEVVSVDCMTLIKQHGSLHCATSVTP